MMMASLTATTVSQPVIDIDDDDDEDESIDEDQLTEFKEQLVSLGSFAVRLKKMSDMR